MKFITLFFVGAIKLKGEIELFENITEKIHTKLASYKQGGMSKTQLIKAGYEMIMNSKGDSGAILAGIMITIIGFATLMVGNYIIFAISTSLPAMASANYNTTSTSVLTYVTTVLPIRTEC